VARTSQGWYHLAGFFTRVTEQGWSMDLTDKQLPTSKLIKFLAEDTPVLQAVSRAASVLVQRCGEGQSDSALRSTLERTASVTRDLYRRQESLLHELEPPTQSAQDASSDLPPESASKTTHHFCDFLLATCGTRGVMLGVAAIVSFLWFRFDWCREMAIAARHAQAADAHQDAALAAASDHCSRWCTIYSDNHDLARCVEGLKERLNAYFVHERPPGGSCGAAEGDVMRVFREVGRLNYELLESVEPSPVSNDAINDIRNFSVQ